MVCHLRVNCQMNRRFSLAMEYIVCCGCSWPRPGSSVSPPPLTTGERRLLEQGSCDATVVQICLIRKLGAETEDRSKGTYMGPLVHSHSPRLRTWGKSVFPRPSITYRGQLYIGSKYETLDKNCHQQLDTIITTKKYKSWRYNKGYEFPHCGAFHTSGNSCHLELSG